ncbi:phosphoribosyltransferase family protein [Tenacibaculum finnmarkense]|uniref:Phosphoribosyltransferase n=1 Tax=Tenacibaculum finnmarkense genomovar ulcerans TaxID=2781388 RepID=A0A2I2M7X6_9FLAO|nr:phosphoribosyltransferase family protein [Tenacibaculum finnmarkense]MBE7697171.1 ribose-phosphate pyrophosphokinase [Tenacibaculum finnmarkense genomovar ulcerans]MCD8409830.1 ribose-phosphate pyrophosphokinase [Tenacibaculum finnmarkense genomovar ulcerans]MCD8431224.1 ribose-phosphate pyrophosphokinase [Tenacibaculum finnmarkense genomovar ulcerans]MCG8732540.1 ribose-phosphate pyrophosphokinase [Tenacibaculum finnmarkense]MCG8748699.1 ribose-phosphate pyrophosphokinase [Tenacibaculum fi
MNYEIKKFNDGQVTAKILEKGNLHVKIRGNTYEDLFRIASIKEAWDAENRLHKTATAILTMYCLIGQRSDRRFNEKESFDLKVIANFINSMGFDKVEILHPHSSISLALIDNSVELKSYEYVKKAYHAIGNPVLISPDAGAYKTTHEIAEKLEADLIPSNKVRIAGAPKITIQGAVKNKECLIVDDLADGGRTFNFLAKELKNQGATKVFLYVTHGQFNYGFDELKENINHIYCTNSYKDITDDFVTQFKVV